MLKESLKEKSQNLLEDESITMFPSVVDYYNKEKEVWAQEGLKPEQQIKTARQINQMMVLIRRATMLGKYNWRHYNELAEILDFYAKEGCHSPAERLRVFGGIEHLLLKGDEALKKVCYWYENYPEEYAEGIAPNREGVKLDKIRRFFQKDSVPNYSFISFAKGENPALSYSTKIWDKVVELESFKKVDEPYLYKKWVEESKTGKKYAYDKMVYKHALLDLTLQAQDFLGVEERTMRSRKKDR